jgi:integrase
MMFESVREYVGRKRSFGLEYKGPGVTLSSFAKQVGDIPLSRVTPQQVSLFLDRPRTSPNAWLAKFNLLKHFFEHWAARGMLQTLPMPCVRPASPSGFVPHIYSRTELQRLLQGTRLSQGKAACRMDSATFRMFLLFLYATGALVGEALRLSQEDVDLKNDWVTIHSKRFNRIRRIPDPTNQNGPVFGAVVSRDRKSSPADRAGYKPVPIHA